ncbi:hypothetical protein F183_A46310 [Bryobacterales bacterium F-183]|nr:hypothetical protein F183_A46310 [Bryobacterales bacterium F-183]
MADLAAAVAAVDTVVAAAVAVAVPVVVVAAVAATVVRAGNPPSFPHTAAAVLLQDIQYNIARGSLSAGCFALPQNHPPVFAP